MAMTRPGPPAAGREPRAHDESRLLQAGRYPRPTQPLPATPRGDQSLSVRFVKEIELADDRVEDQWTAIANRRHRCSVRDFLAWHSRYLAAFLRRSKAPTECGAGPSVSGCHSE